MQGKSTFTDVEVAGLTPESRKMIPLSISLRIQCDTFLTKLAKVIRRIQKTVSRS